MKKFLFTFSIVTVIIALLLLFLPAKLHEREAPSPSPTVTVSQPTVSIRGKTFVIEIADSPQEKGVGLSGRTSLAQNAGMLFVFESPGMQAFWMKDTLVPLDMIFIGDDKIVTIHRNVPLQAPETPDTQLPRYAPTAPVNYVLEINAGLSDIYGFTEGDTVEIKGIQ